MNRCESGLAEAQLLPDGWTYVYAAIEAPRRGRDVFRPVVPVRLAHDQPSTIAALVDSGSEQTLAAH
jgi:hypothetical protein